MHAFAALTNGTGTDGQFPSVELGRPAWKAEQEPAACSLVVP
jgi:hypothetical protein